MWSEAEDPYEADRRFADNVRAMSNGRMDIETFSSGALMPYEEYFDAVRGHVVELSESGGSYWTGKDKALAAIDQSSIIIGDYPRTFAWFWQGGGLELAREAYAKWGIYYLGSHAYTFAGECIVSKIPIRTIEDCKGLKIRAPDPLMASVWESVGADVMVFPGAEVYTALSTGLIDAADWSSPSANFQMGYAEICPYYSRPGDYYAGGWGDLMIAMDTWNALPEDLKAILEQAARVHQIDMWSLASYSDLTSIGKLKEAGASMITWDPELTKKIKGGIRDNAIKQQSGNPMGEKIVKSLLDFLAQVEAE